MITGVHTMFYTSEPEALRAFFRDKFGLKFTDVGGGWLIFDLPDAELGIHPAGGPQMEHAVVSGTHHISFFCDDIEKTVAELRRKGVEFTQEIQNEDFGRTIQFRVPGGFELMMYQPHYKRA